MAGRRVLVIGLDSAPPELLFRDFVGELPNIGEMLEDGIYGSMLSCHPPITIPAWTVMVTGRNPGSLGLYGFRHRKRNSYTEFYIANSYSIKEKTVWDVLSQDGKHSCVVSVPPSYPPKPLRGCLVSCFITPSAEKDYTYPAGLKVEIEQLIGRYMFDVEFRTEERRKLLKELYDMTERRFKTVSHLMGKRKWDFFMFVEIGVDRVHHAFWKFFDRTHQKYVPGNEFEDVIRDYYKFIDVKVGELLKKAGKDTVVFVVSDHGTKKMKGAFCINEWLSNEGYLSAKTPERAVDLEEADVNWSRTKAWGWGGYYARVFLNVKGREPLGCIEPENYESEREELAEKIRGIRDPDGRRMNTKVFKPEELYPELKGDPPDLLVYFDDLYWRSAGTLGQNTIYLSENDKGPDDAVHSMYGTYIMHDPERTLGRKELTEVDILDVAPTLLKVLGYPRLEGLEGRVLGEV